jgi:hypothetical protein
LQCHFAYAKLQLSITTPPHKKETDMLEQKLEELIVAINAQTEAIKAQTEVLKPREFATATAVVPQLNATEAVAALHGHVNKKKVKSLKEVEEAEVATATVEALAAVAEVKAEPVAEVQQEPEAAAVTYAMVRDVLMEVNVKHGRSGVLWVLQQKDVDAPNVPAIEKKPETLPAALRLAKEALAMDKAALGG